jgi:acetyl esterase/lipase
MTPTVVRLDPAAPYDVEETDVAFAKPEGEDLLARVYRPKGTPAAPLAPVVDVHGGAWTYGDRTSGAIHGRALAASGLVVVSLDFRQGPARQHPAASADIAAGVRWVRAHAGRLGVDPRGLGVIGASSGGHLALLLAVRPGAPEHGGTPILMPDGSLGPTTGDDAVAWVVALYPVADPLARYRYVLTREHEAPSGFDARRLIAAHRGYYKSETDMDSASVTRILTSRGEARAVPPAWLAQPEFDDNVPSAITDALVSAYRTAGGSLEHVRFPGASHGFITKPGPATEKCIGMMRDFIGRRLASA